MLAHVLNPWYSTLNTPGVTLTELQRNTLAHVTRNKHMKMKWVGGCLILELNNTEHMKQNGKQLKNQ